MPMYDFEDIDTGVRFSLQLSIAKKEEYLKENLNIKQILGSPSLVRGHGLQGKNDEGWKENLARIAEAHPGTALAEKVGGRSSKEIKTREILKKHKIIE